MKHFFSCAMLIGAAVWLVGCGGGTSKEQEESKARFDKYWPNYVARKLGVKPLMAAMDYGSGLTDDSDYERLGYWLVQQAKEAGPVRYPGPDSGDNRWRNRPLTAADVKMMGFPDIANCPYPKMKASFKSTDVDGVDGVKQFAFSWYDLRTGGFEKFDKIEAAKEQFRTAFNEGAEKEFSTYCARLEAEGDPHRQFNEAKRFRELLGKLEEKILPALSK